ncbi:antitoxin [Mycolicibacterium sp. NCC-Tsukiji]|uniref:FitA-like ribbon-helix-helix domain-containing protein n=1 Tax=Mycolicibacterium sp. NCC-Tsukiji TaxID=2185272 RepID=UPI000ED22A6B|nr:antitoxin [Mycolicibacterium sp. NCC-Tsukiji]GCB01043.1 putative antitoxin VapB9 [Mycolicibacterium sp. NCC-Tsukiji]
MRSLQIRNVPDDLMERLEQLARASNTSVEAVAIGELDLATRRVDNAALLATLSDLSNPTEAIVEHVRASRR